MGLTVNFTKVEEMVLYKQQQVVKDSSQKAVSGSLGDACVPAGGPALWSSTTGTALKSQC